MPVELDLRHRGVAHAGASAHEPATGVSPERLGGGAKIRARSPRLERELRALELPLDPRDSSGDTATEANRTTSRQVVRRSQRRVDGPDVEAAVGVGRDGRVLLEAQAQEHLSAGPKTQRDAVAGSVVDRAEGGAEVPVE